MEGVTVHRPSEKTKWLSEAPLHSDRRDSEECREGNSAINQEDVPVVNEAFEDIRKKFESGAAHKITGYTIRVPVVLSDTTKLGLHFGDEEGSVQCIDESDIPQFSSTQVQRVDEDGEIGRWNAQQMALDGYDSNHISNETSDLVIQPIGGYGCGTSVWLEAVEVHGNGTHQKFGVKALKLLQEVGRQVRRGAGKARLFIYFFVQSRYQFQYKARKYIGSALHILAVQDPDGRAVARRPSPSYSGSMSALTILEELRDFIDLAEECRFAIGKKIGTCMAIHLAAGVSNIPMIEALVQAEADVNAKSRVDGEENYTALHEAAFFKQTAAVSLLLSMRAEVNSKNMKQQTALHIAASQGGFGACRVLVKYGADVTLEDKHKYTALDQAMESTSYPPHKLFHLTGRSFNDVLKVAKHSPSAATHLLKDVAENRIHDDWTKQLSEEMVRSPAKGLQKWIDLLRMAPTAGEEVIEALTVSPEVLDESHHPLPRRASMPVGINFFCHYTDAEVWEYNGKARQAFPDWHVRLCPGCQERTLPVRLSQTRPSRGRRCLRHLYSVLTGQSRDPINQVRSDTARSEAVGQFKRAQTAIPANQAGLSDLVPVKVVMVKMPGIICPQVLYVLSTVKHPHIFAKTGVRAIVEFVWKNVVRYQYYWKTTQRAAVLILLFCLVCQWIPQDPDSLVRRGSWSLVAAQCYHELFYEIFEAVGYVIELKRPRDYFSKAKNVWDYISIGLGLAMMHLSQHDLFVEAWSTLLAVTVMGRWVMLTWTFRAFVWAGEKILPVLQASFVPMGGILLVTLFIFAGFWHSFAALTLAQGLLDQYQVLLATLRLLILGDGDGAAVVLGLYNGDEDLGSHITFVLWFIAVIAFCICLLNLFIAVHGEAYGKAQETAHISFLQERAAICLHCLLMPSFLPSRWQSQASHPKSFCVLIYVLTFATWAILVWYQSLHPWVAAGALLLGSFIADLVLLRLPWRKEDSEKLFFWICHRDDIDDDPAIPSESFEDGLRLSAEQKEVSVRSTRVSMKLGDLKSSVEAQRYRVEMDLSSLEGRLYSLEKSVERANAALAVLE